MALLGAVCIALGLAFLVAPTASAHGNDDQHKVWVCKYVGTPGQDETLKDGKQPISVDSSATVGTWFNDAQGRSFVLDVQTEANTGPGNTYKGDKTCPDPEGPTPTPTPTETTPTPEPTLTCGDEGYQGDDCETPTPTPTETTPTPTPTTTTPTPTATSSTPMPTTTCGECGGGPTSTPPATLAHTGSVTPWLGGSAAALLLLGGSLLAATIRKPKGLHQ